MVRAVVLGDVGRAGRGIADRGISVNAKSFRAAVWPAMTRVPRPLMPYCKTTEPAETMLLMRPMEMLWLNSSQ